MRISASIVVTLALLLAAGAASAEAPAGKSSDQLLAKALQGSMVQVELGKLAQRNAQSTGVNALGARLAHDHARIGKILAAVSHDRGMVVATSLDSSEREQVESLSAKTGADFDAAYTEQMVSDHEAAIALFKAAAQSDDPSLSQLAKLVLPTLREDQRLASSYEKLNAGYNLQAVASAH